MQRIDAMIIGVEKAGTTSLTRYLSQHPHIVTQKPSVEEFTYFLDDDCCPENFRLAYERCFPRNPLPSECLLAKHIGIIFFPKAAEKLREHNPDCKLIAMFRNPVDRAYSSYWHQRYRGAESLHDFESAIEAEEKHIGDPRWSRHRTYLARGLYYDQLTRLEQIFNKDQLHIVLLDDLKAAPDETVQGVFDFLGVEPKPVDTRATMNRAKYVRWPLLAEGLYKQSAVKTALKEVIPFNIRRSFRKFIQNSNSIERVPPKMNSATREYLIEYYRPHNERLRQLLNRDLSFWDK